MKRLIETIKNIWSIEELRGRIITTLLLVLIFRFGTYLVLPGIDPAALTKFTDKGSSGLLGLFNLFVGGSFARASIFALGIMPYISASIAVQLLSMAIPSFQKMQREGESGRRKINQYTRIFTIIITLFQSIAYVTYLNSQIPEGGILINPFLFRISTMVLLTAGTMFCLWMGEKITDKGIGNGVSLLIMIGIMARFPGALLSEFQGRIAAGGGGMITFLVEILFLVSIVFFIVLLVQGTRKIPIQYAKRIIGNKQYGGVRQYLPLKVNAAGVMPIIFAQAIMFVPALVLQAFPKTDSGFLYDLAQYTSISHSLLFGFLVVVFTYFYTALIVNPQMMADEMKKNGGFIPGVKPGKSTASYIDTIMSRITLPGSVFLAFVAILPAFAGLIKINSQFASFFGGTSILIMVGTILDTLQQVESHLLMRHYDGLMKTGRIKGRTPANAAISVPQG
jgi:preprotein translocase subunit SecY